MSRDDFEAIKEYSANKFNADRKRFLSDAIARDDGGWTKHGEYHWSRMVNGSRLDYWPSRKKFQFKGRIMRGDVASFLRRQALKGGE